MNKIMSDEKTLNGELHPVNMLVKIAWKWVCFNSMFVSIVALFVFIFITSAVIEAGIEINVCSTILNSFGVFCQIITSLMGCITSIIAISFSLQDSDFFGIKTKDLNAMRVKTHFGPCSCVIVSIFLVAFNAIFYLARCIFLCSGVSVISIFFCVYITATEVPLMVKNEKSGIRILKDIFLCGENVKGFFSEKFNDALKYLIIEKNLKTTYDHLKFSSQKHAMYNRDILLKLLDLQSDLANDLKYIVDMERNLKTSNVLQDNLRDLLGFSFDIKTVVDEPYKNYVHYVARTIYGLYNNEVSKEDALEIVACLVNVLNYSSFNDEKKDFIFTTIFTMVTTTVKKGDFNFAIAIKKHYSSYSLFLSDKNMSAILFSLLSMFFFYLCRKSTSVPKSIAENTVKFIESYRDELGEGNTGYKSWKTLYRRYVEGFDIDLSALYKAFEANEHAIEYWRYNEAQYVVVDKNFFMEWYLSNFYLSYKRYEHDYNSLLKTATKDNAAYHFLYACQNFLDGDGNYVIPSDMQELATLYECNDLLIGMVDYENSTRDLYEFVNTFKKDELLVQVDKCKKINNDSLSNKYKYAVETAIKSEWGYNENLSEFGESGQLRIYFEKDEESLNLDDVITRYLIDSIFSKIRSSIGVTTVYRDENFEAELLRLSDSQVEYISKNLINIVKRHINDSTQKEKVLNKFAKAKEIRGKILENDLLVLSTQFSFNCTIDELSIRPLNEAELSEKITEFKRDDGQYTYRGVFLTRQELEKIVYEKHVILTVRIRCATTIEQGNNYVIKLWKKNE